MNKKDTTLLIVLIITSALFIILPLRLKEGWHFVLQLMIYTLISYIIIKSNQQSVDPIENNKAPNSNLQIAIWTILFASLLSASFAHNLHTAKCISDALNIKIPSGYWILLGISGVTQAVQTFTKTDQNTKEGLFFNHRTKEGIVESQTSEGLTYQKIDFEISAAAIERIQFTLFLIITSVSFALYSYQYLGINSSNCITELPVISDTIAILSGVSNGVYLAPKLLKNT